MEFFLLTVVFFFCTIRTSFGGFSFSHPETFRNVSNLLRYVSRGLEKRNHFRKSSL
ncbi:hypothetical protein LEP1GSC061_0500 [Leptospira wolffii serovar Khorat str. Khorat-H2]|nr:hypothetical protein LEP1GSC061_0500 [Leptospira wolffii serovar Khorat str. Khorat-H2]